MLLLELPSEDAANINSSGIHTRRERTTPNANLKVENIRLIGERNQQRLSDTVRERIGEPTIRQNAVLCVEMLLTKAKKKVIEETNWQAVKKYLIGKRKLPTWSSR